MITDHKWICTRESCDFSIFLRVDDSKQFDLYRLSKFERAVTNHVFINEFSKLKHEVIHRQKEWKFNIRLNK